MAALLTTLFVPSVVLLVPLYIEVVHPPLIHHSFVNSYWAIWLPESASAFNVVLMKRFFDNLPREIFEAARIDGCGPVRLFVSIVLPMSRPILGVVSIFARARLVEGLPLAAARPRRHEPAAAVGAPAGDRRRRRSSASSSPRCWSRASSRSSAFSFSSARSCAGPGSAER